MSSTILVILDGWGIGPENETNAVHTAETPSMDYIRENFPGGTLKAHGIAVGLPWQTPGKSDAGHLVIGTGRIPENDDPVQYSISEIVAAQGKVQLKITETVRERHINFFLNGKHEAPFKKEFRVTLPSLKDADPARSPAMAARPITDRILMSIQEGGFDLIITNYPNADVMAHTGNTEAAYEAIRVIDTEIRRLATPALKGDHTLIITADHGNAEKIIDKKSGRPEDHHTTNPVPFYIVGKQFQGMARKTPGDRKPVGLLSDIAPTVLTLMGLPIPPEMTGSDLLPQLT